MPTTGRAINFYTFFPLRSGRSEGKEGNKYIPCMIFIIAFTNAQIVVYYSFEVRASVVCFPFSEKKEKLAFLWNDSNKYVNRTESPY